MQAGVAGGTKAGKVAGAAAEAGEMGRGTVRGLTVLRWTHQQSCADGLPDCWLMGLLGV